MRNRSWSGGLLLVLVVSACGGADGPADAGGFDSPVGDGSVAFAPDIPWLDEGAPPIAIAPCPDGWREVEDGGGGIATCDPYPEGGALECPDGEVHFLGEAGCAPVGGVCPVGEFSDTLPTDRSIVHVRAGAMGGDGSAASPFGSLTDFAVGGLSAGTVIALSRGTHRGSMRLVRGIALWGACAADTVLTTPVASTSEAVVMIVRAQGEVRDLTVADSPRPGVWVTGDGADGLVEGVVIERTQIMALDAAFGATLAARGVVTREIRESGGEFGRALIAERAATVEISRAVLERSRDLGLYVGDMGTTVVVEDVVVRDGLGSQSGIQGRALEALGGAAVTVRQSLFVRNAEVGLLVGQEGTTLAADHLVVRGTMSQRSDMEDGRGMGVQLDATADVTRTLLDGNRTMGAHVGSGGTVFRASDLVVRDTLEEEIDGSSGRGLNVQEGALVELSNVVLERNRNVGVFAALAGTSVTLSDVVVRDTAGNASDGGSGRGLALQDGAWADVTRVSIERSRQLGVVAGDAGSVLSASALVVRDTEGQESDLAFGRGLVVQRGASAVMTGLLVERSRDLGVFAAGADTRAMLTDAAVRDSRAHGCTSPGCPVPGGHGAGSYRSASLSMLRFEIARAEVCGVHIGAEGQVDLMDGEVRESTIGACLQADPYDVDRISSTVRYDDNGVNLQSTTLPVPEPAEMLAIEEGP